MNSQGARACLILIALLALLQLFQQFFHPIKLAGLQGAFEKGSQPAFSYDSWFNGKFQQQYDHYLKYNTAFNGELVRLRNQVDYSAFGNINTILTLGKENYIFDPNYIAAMNGTDLISDSVMQEKTKAISATVTWLDLHKIPLIIIFAPNKAHYYSGYLNSAPVVPGTTNRAYFKNLLTEKNITSIDFDEWFMEIKDTASFPLIPKYGAHWSSYGSWLAADSIFQVIQDNNDELISSFELQQLTTSSKAKFTDDDYLASLNLMVKWKSPVMAYPELRFINGRKPNILVVSDSFIWNLFDLGIFQNCFSEKSLVRYYNKTLFDSHKNNLGPTAEVSREELESRDCIIVITSDPSLKDFGFGFFESAAKLTGR